jgi:aminoglycoside/choline kinase family phosphotransferase
MRLHAPVVEMAKTDAGFVLLSDLGSVQYLGALQENPALSASLYADALTALARLQERGIEFQHQLPPYDEKLLRFELSLFSDWLCDRHLGIRLDAADTRKWRACCDLLVSSALSQPPVFVHRDYHSRNLMLVDKNNPGILDFQDAVEGPLTYDLVSLLRDCYISWPAAQVRDLALKFQGMSEPARNIAPAEFLRFFDLMGVQRQLKAAGIFARLNHRDGKSSYMLDIPRTLNYIVEIAPHHPELGFLAALVQGRVLRGLRDRPA